MGPWSSKPRRPPADDLDPVVEWKQAGDDRDVVEIYLPGFKKEQVHVLVDDYGVLSAAGERPARGGTRRERFRKDFRLPDNCDVHGVRAEFVEKLVITLPIVPAPTPPSSPESKTLPSPSFSLPPPVTPRPPVYPDESPPPPPALSPSPPLSPAHTGPSPSRSPSPPPPPPPYFKPPPPATPRPPVYPDEPPPPPPALSPSPPLSPAHTGPSPTRSPSPPPPPPPYFKPPPPALSPSPPLSPAHTEPSPTRSPSPPLPPPPPPPPPPYFKPPPRRRSSPPPVMSHPLPPPRHPSPPPPLHHPPSPSSYIRMKKRRYLDLDEPPSPRHRPPPPPPPPSRHPLPPPPPTYSDLLPSSSPLKPIAATEPATSQSPPGTPADTTEPKQPAALLERKISIASSPSPRDQEGEAPKKQLQDGKMPEVDDGEVSKPLSPEEEDKQKKGKGDTSVEVMRQRKVDEAMDDAE